MTQNITNEFGFTPDQTRAICELLQEGRIIKHLLDDGGIAYIESANKQFREPRYIQAIQLMYKNFLIVVSEPQPIFPSSMTTVIYSPTNKGRDFLRNYQNDSSKGEKSGS